MTVAAVSGSASLPTTGRISPATLAQSIAQLAASIEQLVARLGAAQVGATPVTPAVDAAVAGGGGTATGCGCHAGAQATAGASTLGTTAGGANGGVDAAAAAPAAPAAPREVERSAPASRAATRQAASTSQAGASVPVSGAPVDADIKRRNPRNVEEMLDWVRKEVDNPHESYKGLCGHFSAAAFGWAHSGENYAIDQWKNAPSNTKHAGDTNPPAGALVFWETGSRPGHVAVSMGNGMVASNDIRRSGKIDIVPLSEITRKWNADYQGWTPPYFPKAG